MDREISDKLRFGYINKCISGKEILDIGSAEGFLHNLLVSKNPDKKFYTLDVDGAPDFKVDLNNPKKLGKTFDTIIAGEILEHVHNPTNFIKFCFDHLNKGGRLVLTTPNAIGIQYLRNPAWCVNRDEFDQHIHAFTMPMLNLLFRKTGFRVAKEDFINAFWLNRNPLQLISYIIKRIRTDLLIVGEK